MDNAIHLLTTRFQTERNTLFIKYLPMVNISQRTTPKDHLPHRKSGKQLLSHKTFWDINEANASFSIVLTHWPRLLVAVKQRSFACALNWNNSYQTIKQQRSFSVFRQPHLNTRAVGIIGNILCKPEKQSRICITNENSSNSPRYFSKTIRQMKENTGFFLTSSQEHIYQLIKKSSDNK